MCIYNPIMYILNKASTTTIIPIWDMKENEAPGVPAQCGLLLSGGPSLLSNPLSSRGSRLQAPVAGLGFAPNQV